jgi:NAD+ kinase
MSPAPRTVGVIASPHRADAVEAARHAVEWLSGHGLTVLVDPETAATLGREADGASSFYDQVDLVIVLGGDGRVIAAARAASESGKPVVGVNFGTFGFLAEIHADDLEPALSALAAGRYEVEERLMLLAEVCEAGHLESAVAANDVVVKTTDPAHVLELRVHADGDLIAEIPADGLILATPTGSTAYSLSAGGPVVVPDLPAIVLTPICPHTLSTRPIVLSAAVEVSVEVVPSRQSNAAVVSVDGWISLDLRADGLLHVRRAERCMRLARLQRSAFFDSLRGKLRWGKPK